MTDEDRVRHLWSSMAERWNEKDAEGFAAHFAEDCDFTNVRGHKPQGRAGIEAGHGHLFRTDYRGTSLTARVRSVRFPGRDIAVVNAESTIASADGTPLATTHALAVLERPANGGAWSITSFHNMIPR
jgi:uncharacterized protein (TIGR02246 family)